MTPTAKTEAVAAFVRRTTKAQKLPAKLTRKATLLDVARLLRR